MLTAIQVMLSTPVRECVNVPKLRFDTEKHPWERTMIVSLSQGLCNQLLYIFSCIKRSLVKHSFFFQIQAKNNSTSFAMTVSYFKPGSTGKDLDIVNRVFNLRHCVSSVEIDGFVIFYSHWWLCSVVLSFFFSQAPTQSTMYVFTLARLG